jgi:hydroxymethylbilane synthase
MTVLGATKKTPIIEKINIGTRRSQLAIAQVDSIIEQLKAIAPEPEYVSRVVSTMADENQVKAFSAFDSKSIWTEELEKLLMDGKLDVVVHCLKGRSQWISSLMSHPMRTWPHTRRTPTNTNIDMPTSLPSSCSLGVICEREDPRDVVVMKNNSPYKRIQDLPAGSTVGTSSVRRKAQTFRHFPHLKCEDVRGNLNTRLRKLDDDESQYDCLILAAAGLKRIDLGHRITQYLSAEDGVLYAPGQGALGLEIREGDERMLDFLSVLTHRETTLACLAERSLLKTLQGGCSAPVGVETSWNGDELLLKSSVISPDGKDMVESRKSSVVKMQDEAVRLGDELAQQLLGLGADKILRDLRMNA